VPEFQELLLFGLQMGIEQSAIVAVRSATRHAFGSPNPEIVRDDALGVRLENNHPAISTGKSRTPSHTLSRYRGVNLIGNTPRRHANFQKRAREFPELHLIYPTDQRKQAASLARAIRGNAGDRYFSQEKIGSSTLDTSAADVTRIANPYSIAKR